jgi:outer membrane receptor protein involved in Fe transport
MNRRPMNVGRAVVLVLMLGCLSAPALLAQTSYATINGTVRDPSGAVVPGAQVTLANADTGVKVTRETNASGFYVFVNVPPGNYTLSVQAQGFSTAETPVFPVRVNDTQTHDVTLTVGAVAETVEVRAEAALLQQSTSELGTVIGEEAVRDLPLNGRNFSQLLTLTPGATPISTAQGAGGGTSFNAPVALPGSAFTLPSIHGQWNRSNMYMLDGLPNHWFFGQSWAVLPIVDALQEFKVQAHNDKAEFGGVLGGVMNVVSKSGTNELHAAGWWFVRNDAFDARNPFTDATAKGPTPFRQNQFGATIGGPVLLPKLYQGRNRTFFQFAYEGWRYSRSQQQTYFHPTDAELAGDFSNSILRQPIFDPATTRTDPNNPQGFIRQPFAGNQIPQSRIDPLSLNYMKNYLDRPNISNPSFNVINNRPQRSDSDTFTVKIDHRFRDEDSVWFRYSAMNVPQNIPTTVKNGQLFEDRPRNVGGGWIHLLGSSVVFDTKVGWGRYSRVQDLLSTVGLGPLRQDGWVGVDSFGAPSYGFQAPYGGSGINFPRPEFDWQWIVSEGVSWIRGNHNMKFGGLLIWQKRDALTTQHSIPFNNAQTADPSRPGTTGNSVASALLGLPAQYTIRNQKYIARWPSFGFYGQDEWKVTPRVTLNFGLRYDTFNIASLNPGMNNGFDWGTGDWLIGGGKLPPPCSQAGRAPCIPGKGDLSDIPNGNHIRVNKYPYLYRSPRDGFQPRVGVAWRMLERTVLRAGYGVTFDTYTGVMQTFQQSIGTWPDKQFAQPAYNAVGERLTSVGEANKLGGVPLPDPTPFGSAGWYADPEFDNAYSHQWNVEIQQQMASDLTLSVAYVGSRTFRLDHNGAANTALTPGPGSPAEVRARKPYPWQSSIFMSIYDNKAWYDSLQVKLNKRFSRGFQALLSYTWSKALDYQSGWFGAENGIGGDAAVQDYYHPEASKGPAGYNIPHFLSIGAVYELPFGKGKPMLNSGAAAAVLGGWQINTIAQFRSGQPFNLNVSGDVANIGNDVAWWNYARPNLVGNPYLDKPTQERWFNTEAFAAPVLSYGNFGKNVLSTESVQNIDLSVFKKFAIRERYIWELRFESFNTFNIMNLGAPGITLGTPTFGRISSLATGTRPRVLQFGVKFSF